MFVDEKKGTHKCNQLSVAFHSKTKSGLPSIIRLSHKSYNTSTKDMLSFSIEKNTNSPK